MGNNFNLILDENGRGCKFKDKILVPLTPSEVEDIEAVFERQALQSNNYVQQGQNRKIKDLMSEALEHWRNKRYK